MYPKFLIYKLPNFSNKNDSSICKRLFRSAINKRTNELQHVSTEVSISKKFLSKQLSITDFYIIKKSITLHNKKSLQNLLHTQQKKLSSLKRGYSVPIFTTNETITNLTQYELSQKESPCILCILRHYTMPTVRLAKPWKK